jgi:hypothetical protein
MLNAQNILLLGGLVNVFISVIVAYALYWQRLRDSTRPATAGLVAHKVTLWNGFLLFGLAVAMPHTGFTAAVNNGLAAAEVAICLLAGGRSIWIWWARKGNIFKAGGLIVRSVGLGHIVDLVVIAGVLYGVARTAFGI